MVEPRLKGPEVNLKPSYAGTFDSHKRAFSDNPNHNHRFYRGKSLIISGSNIDFFDTLLQRARFYQKLEMTKGICEIMRDWQESFIMMYTIQCATVKSTNKKFTLWSKYID